MNDVRAESFVVLVGLKIAFRVAGPRSKRTWSGIRRNLPVELPSPPDTGMGRIEELRLAPSLSVVV